MRSFRIFNQRATAVFAAAALVFATLVPTLVEAATVTERSIALSTSVKNTAGVTYEVKFKAQHASTGAFILEFCDTPTINTACTTAGGAAGIDTTSVNTTGSDTVTPINTNKAVKVILNTPVGVGGAVDVVLTGIHNPTAAGVFYARIVTYTDGAAITSDYVDADTLGTYYDDGSVALSLTDGFSITGRALETMTFCASGASIPDNCVTTSSPNLTLGSGGVLTGTLSTGDVYTKISTNAAGGAVVNLRSGATGCGGLVRLGATSNAVGCGITPKTSAGTIATDEGSFGVKLTLAGGTVVSGSYHATNYYMGYAGNDTSGVTGPYGDPIYNTGAAPINGGTAQLTFGANVSPLTPAGTYSATFNLIATGTF